MTARRITFPDIEFSLDIKHKEYRIEFIAYKRILGPYKNDVKAMFYNKEGSLVYDRQEARPYLHGHVKYDGCSNWFIDEQERCTLHFCELDEIIAISELMKRCWEYTSENLESFQHDQ